MGEVLEIVKTLVSPTEKLMNMVGDAIGTAYEPRHKRKMAEATAHEINVIADAMRNAADMPVVYNQDGVAINTEDFNRLIQRAGNRLLLQETVKQHNIECVIDNAYAELENENSCSETPVEQGWINGFFDSVANVSNEDLQIIWGKVLAGEINRPNSFSLRTLETLKNLSKHEAELFQKIMPYVLQLENNVFLISEGDILKKFGIPYDEMMSLDECGLINSSGMVSLYHDISSSNTVVYYNSSEILFINGLLSEKMRISIGVFSLTQAGRELYSILNFQSAPDYIYELAKYIGNRYKGILNVSVHKINNQSDGKINYEDIALYKFPTEE